VAALVVELDPSRYDRELLRHRPVEDRVWNEACAAESEERRVPSLTLTTSQYDRQDIATYTQLVDTRLPPGGSRKDGMTRDPLSSSADDPRRCQTVELEEAPCDDRNGI
jgi:hypothetical protein